MPAMQRLRTLRPDHEPLWVRLDVQPIGGQWATRLVAEGAAPPRPGQVKGMGFVAETPAEAEERALRSVGRCPAQSCEGVVGSPRTGPVCGKALPGRQRSAGAATHRAALSRRQRFPPGAEAKAIRGSRTAALEAVWDAKTIRERCGGE